MKKLTREERRKRSQRRLMYITYLLFLVLLLGWLGSYLVITAEADSEMETAVEDTGRLPGDDTPATTRCYMTEEEVEAAENELIEAALLARSHKLEDVTIIAGLSIKAAKGDAKAAKVLFDLLGDQSKTEDEVKVVIDV